MFETFHIHGHRYYFTWMTDRTEAGNKLIYFWLKQCIYALGSTQCVRNKNKWKQVKLCLKLRCKYLNQIPNVHFTTYSLLQRTCEQNESFSFFFFFFLVTSADGECSVVGTMANVL